MKTRADGQKPMTKIDAKERERRAAIIMQRGGILPQYDAFYNLSVHYLAEQGKEAFDRYLERVNSGCSPDALIATVQTAVGHAAALSRYFWPSVSESKRKTAVGQLRVARGGRLRSTFKMADESPLHRRPLRNAWEHFDERLDGYLLSVDAGVFMPTGLIGDHSAADDPIGHVFKLLDPEAECLVLLNKKYFFGPIRAEVRRIVILAE